MCVTVVEACGGRLADSGMVWLADPGWAVILGAEDSIFFHAAVPAGRAATVQDGQQPTADACAKIGCMHT